jgi:hypothetical protein
MAEAPLAREDGALAVLKPEAPLAHQAASAASRSSSSSVFQAPTEART